MKLYGLVIFVLSLFNCVFGKTDFATENFVVSIWLTSTIDGTPTTYYGPWTKTFSRYNTDTSSASSVSLGSIGIGTLSGQVGKIRTYEYTTISKNAGSSNGLKMFAATKHLSSGCTFALAAIFLSFILTILV